LLLVVACTFVANHISLFTVNSKLFTRVYYFILPLLFGYTSSAQLQQGYKVGLNASKFIYNKNYKPGDQVGPNVGVLVKVPLEKKIFLQPELIYSLKGHKIDEPDLYYKGNLHLHYLNIPIMLGNQLNKLDFMMGPELGYLMYRQYKTTPDINFSDAFRKIDLSLNAGLHYKIVGGLGIEIRYNYGILKLIEVPERDSEGFVVGKTYVGRNRVFQIAFDYTPTRK